MGSSGLSVGLTGLLISQRALQTIGHNIANANTPGYTRQVNILTARNPLETPFGVIGQGVKLDKILRMKDDVVSNQILDFKSLLGNSATQTEVLKHVEGIFNELSEHSLGNVIERFFEGIQELAINPELKSSRYQVLQDGLNLANTFQYLDTQLKQLRSDNGEQIDAKVTELNTNTVQIADLNKRITAITLSNGNAGDLLDQRDVLVNRLSELADIRVVNNDNGTINVILGGTLVVHGNNTEQLSTTATGGGTYRINGIATPINGELKGLLDIQDVLLSSSDNTGYMDQLDILAKSIIKQINDIHSEGAGLDGGFKTLTSTNAVNSVTDLLTDTGLAFTPTTGNLYVTVRNDTSGAITKNNITIVAGETLTTLKDKLDLIANLNASLSGLNMTVNTDTGYTYSFTKALDTNPGSISGSTVSLYGHYDGSDNDVYTFDVQDAGTGTIGTGSASIRVRDSALATLAILDVGSSYTAGDVLQIGDGVSVSFGSGALVVGNTLAFDVVSDPDTTSVLTALGLNTFFKGSDASTIGVTEYIQSDIARIGAASSDSKGDNTNALRLADVQNNTATATLSFRDYLTGIASELAIDLQVKSGEEASYSALVLNLENRRQAISGVSIEEEMINIVRFQQAFQASARYISIMAELGEVLVNL
jgi:flagellar hook-associated protein 1 FlgK